MVLDWRDDDARKRQLWLPRWRLSQQFLFIQQSMVFVILAKDLDLPPTTPLAMAAVFFDLEEGRGGVGPGAGDVVLVADEGAVDSGASDHSTCELCEDVSYTESTRTRICLSCSEIKRIGHYEGRDCLCLEGPAIRGKDLPSK
jgi:hypothetical protein